MRHSKQTRAEQIERLVEAYRKRLKKEFPQTPQSLEEIERIAEQIGRKTQEEVQREGSEQHGQGYQGLACTCACGGTARFKGYRRRQVVTTGGEVRLERAYYHCGGCGKGFAPMDTALGLDGYCTSVGVRVRVARLAVWMPFAQVSLELAALCGWQVSKNTIERVSEAMGRRYQQERSQQEAAILAGETACSEAAAGRLYIAIDGTQVPMRAGQWREAKTGVVYETPPQGGPDRKQRAEYVATLAGVEAFGERVYALAFERGVEQAQEVLVLGDGAPWVWKSFTDHYPKAVQILDFYHASEHLAEISQAWYGEGTVKARQWLQARQADLLADGVARVLRSIRAWRPPERDGQQMRRKNLRYFQTNQERMRYGTFREKGYHIGSGVVESACKSVVGQRLKQAGMHWSEGGAEAMLNLRAFLLSRPQADLRPYARSLQ